MTSRAALLFDLDGTLVDSDPKHLAAFQRVFASFGIAVDRTTYESDIHGASNESIGRVFLSHLTTEQRRAVLDDKEAAYRSEACRHRADRGRRRAARLRRSART